MVYVVRKLLAGKNKKIKIKNKDKINVGNGVVAVPREIIAVV